MRIMPVLKGFILLRVVLGLYFLIAFSMILNRNGSQLEEVSCSLIRNDQYTHTHTHTHPHAHAHAHTHTHTHTHTHDNNIKAK